MRKKERLRLNFHEPLTLGGFFRMVIILYPPRLALGNKMMRIRAGFCSSGDGVKYTKPYLSFEQQADLLISRGLVAEKNILISRLQSVSYYRLSGYIFPFRLTGDRIKDGTTLDIVWDRYLFDRTLRMIIMDAIERIEVATRTRIAHEFSELYGAFGYMESKSFPNLKTPDYTRWVGRLTEEFQKSKEPFILHFKQKYDETPMPPIWMLVEVMSFGSTISFYSGLRTDIRKKIARLYGLPEIVFNSWLRTLLVIRNICAHHTRVWDRELSHKPKLPFPSTRYPDWYFPVEISQTRMFAILTISRYLLKHLAPTSRWRERLDLLIKTSSNIPLSEMGFPTGWQESPLWK